MDHTCIRRIGIPPNELNSLGTAHSDRRQPRPLGVRLRVVTEHVDDEVGATGPTTRDLDRTGGAE